MDLDEFGSQVTGVAALAEPVRRDLYLYVVSQAEPVSRDQASEGLGIPRHTVKFHLDRLVEEGLLDIDYKRLSGREGPGAGRPTKRYRRSDRELSVALPARRYDLAGELMASAIDTSARTGTDVVMALSAVAAAHGAAIGQTARSALTSRSSRDARLDAVCGALSSYGYEPRRDGTAVVLANCPFHALAQEHTQLVCGMNLALVEALVAEVGEEALSARLDPASDRCCVTIGARRS